MEHVSTDQLGSHFKSGRPVSRNESIPTGRVRRTAEVGGLVGGQAVRAYATRAANLTRSADARQTAVERRQIEAAEQIVDVLGHMKGVAMKVGQVASFIDLEGLPPDVRDRFQAKLASLRDSAPRVEFKQMRKVIEDDLEQRLEDVFDEFEPEAVAAASIGQVYRARLADGRLVAVKVQYPRVAAAVRADLQNIGLLLRAAKRIAPALDVKAVGAELRERLTEELDYEHEAQEQRTFARRFDGHPFIVVPHVMTEFSGERVLVSEWVDGVGFDEVKRLDQAARDHFGEIVFRFFFGSLYRDGHFSGDPHPGNYELLHDGRVAFMDFGMTKRIKHERLEREKAAIRSSLEGDAEGVRTELAALGFFALDDPNIDSQQLLAYVRSFHDWHADDRPFTITRGYVAELIAGAAPGSRNWDLEKRLSVPPDALFSRRLETLTLGVLGQLEATANWHRIMGELLEGLEPSSDLGKQEAAFFTSDGTI
ncbi:MAG TPA: AarF/ABC1/UbiB kinase family protein [Solirubrobacteraceae bacterium]|jgi:predicted unusual protein kinase regulating ubiquinone biosynthesis (AarF/ABC1/UbiB family)|nr:AarF/ABC1/UbiB kinase family protein [Solirubrobacteraceae bacterium]